MNGTIDPLRVEELEGTMRMLGRAAGVCAQRLLDAGVSPPEIAAMFEGVDAFEHTDLLTERLLVLQILEQPGPRSHRELQDALSDVEPSAISDALEALEAEDALYIGAEQVWASRLVRHLDRLGLIAI